MHLTCGNAPTLNGEKRPSVSAARTRSRRRTTGLTAVVLGLAAVTAGGATTAASAADAPEQIVNGGFDDGLAPWNAYPAASVTDGAGCIDVPAHAGAYAAAIGQTVPMVLDETYTFSFKARITPGLSGTVRAVVQGGEDVN